MAKVKVIEEVREIYWATTSQGILEVNGEKVEFRYAENSNGATFYIRKEEEWNELSSVEIEENETLRTVYYLCLEAPASEIGEEGEEFEFNADDML
jgi:hypothetical protein